MQLDQLTASNFAAFQYQAIIVADKKALDRSKAFLSRIVKFAEVFTAHG